MPTIIEDKLSPEAVEAFCAELYKSPGGKKLRVIRELAAKHGLKISDMAATSFRDGPLDDYIEKLKAKSERAQRVAAYAREGVSMTEAASIRLQESVFDKLMSGDVDDLTAEERNVYSLIIERARLGDQRGAKLSADLKLRDEQIAKLQSEAKDRADRAAAAKAALEGVKSKGGLTPETLKRIEEAAGLL